jgi:chorismate dehydratase
MIPIRLGRMAYINTLPVDWGLVRGGLGDWVTLHRGTPTTLNRLLADGQLDASPVSSVAAAEHAADWLVLDHLCIGSRGEVGSVVLHSAVPIRELEGRSIAVTAESATAAKLLRVLLERHWKVQAQLIRDNESSGARFHKGQNQELLLTRNGSRQFPSLARLLIGDPALKTAQLDPHGLIYDLGKVWQDYTGRGFVFGLWCARREFVENRPEEARMLYHLLRASRALGLVENAKVVAEAATVTGLSESKIKSYFTKLVYDLDEELWEGLNHFLSLLGYDPGLLQRFGEADRYTEHGPIRYPGSLREDVLDSVSH